MSTAVLERPHDAPDPDLEWVVLREPASTSRRRVETIGRGSERRGIIGRRDVQRPPRTLVALPSVDDLTA